MGTLLARRRTLRRASSSNYITQPPSIAIFTPDERGQSDSHHEPETFGTCNIPADPYTAWLEQREVERDREDHAQVRWVVRPRPLAAPAIRAAAADQQVVERRERCSRPFAVRLTSV
jgi:hypothetical protein